MFVLLAAPQEHCTFSRLTISACFFVCSRVGGGTRSSKDSDREMHKRATLPREGTSHS